MTKFSKSQKIILNFALPFCILIFAFCISQKVIAAELFFEARNQEFTQGEEFLVNVFLNTEGESINAVEGKIVFPDIVELKEIRDGNSIINFWIERPKVEQAGIIGFSGIIPGGYQETKGFVFSVVFRAKASGSGTIEIREAKVLLNDGKGTPANLSISNFQFSISKEVLTTQPPVPEIKDLEPPENFKPEIASDPTIFEGKWFLVFATQDKGSGIDHYEISETKRKTIRETDAKWTEVESPYLLKDQKLRSYIYVKAIDKAGNERVIMLSPRYPLKWYEKWEIWVIIIVAIVIMYLILSIFRKRRHLSRFSD